MEIEGHFAYSIRTRVLVVTKLPIPEYTGVGSKTGPDGGTTCAGTLTWNRARNFVPFKITARFPDLPFRACWSAPRLSMVRVPTPGMGNDGVK